MTLNEQRWDRSHVKPSQGLGSDWGAIADTMYDDGKGVEQNFDEAERLYHLAVVGVHKQIHCLVPEFKTKLAAVQLFLYDNGHHPLRGHYMKFGRIVISISRNHTDRRDDRLAMASLST